MVDQPHLPALLSEPRVDIHMRRPRPLGGLPPRLFGRRSPCRPELVLLAPVVPLPLLAQALAATGDPLHLRRGRCVGQLLLSGARVRE